MLLLDTVDLMKKYAKKASKFCMYVLWDTELNTYSGPAKVYCSNGGDF